MHSLKTHHNNWIKCHESAYGHVLTSRKTKQADAWLMMTIYRLMDDDDDLPIAWELSKARMVGCSSYVSHGETLTAGRLRG
jgi:hypothetical protein